jgi:hypothetical protein
MQRALNEGCAMSQEKQSVAFTKGNVVSIGYQYWTERGLPGHARAGWYIKIRLQDEEVGQSVCYAMDRAANKELNCRSITYLAPEQIVSVEVAQEREKDQWLLWIIRFLRREGYVDRNQELTAYVSFGLPYESS